jgi:cytochrome c oxidase subunit IV
MNKTYWLTWLALLGVTLVMILVGSAPFPKAAMLVLVLCGMTVKAGLITANFMHLRFERLSLIATVVGSTVFIVVFLYFLMSIDGLWIHQSAVK